MELMEASRISNGIFLEQASHEGVSSIEQTEKDLKQALADGDSSKAQQLQKQLEALHTFGGPYAGPEGLNMLPGKDDTTPLEAGFYPKGTTKQDIDDYIVQHPEQKEAILDIITAVEADTDGKYKTIPFSERYKKYYVPICDHLDRAATILKEELPELSAFLYARSDALRHNKPLTETDIMWMKLPDTCPIDVVIGPIETYEDQIEGVKGSFQTVLFVRANEEMALLERLKALMNEMEMNIPIDAKYRQTKGQSESTTRIELYRAFHLGGCSATPSLTLAHNLPNDELVTAQYGNRNQFYTNIQSEKMKHILTPISHVVIAPEMLHYVTEDAFFLHTVLHELSHTLGPGYVQNDGTTTVKSCLTNLYSSIEECKADTLAHFFGLHLCSHPPADGVIFTREQINCLHVTQFASLFRSIRFGIDSAHAKGCVIQLNWIVANGGAFLVKSDSGIEFYSFDFPKFDAAIESLGAELLSIKVDGDRARAEKLIAEYGTTLSPTAQRMLNDLKTVPIDLRVTFVDDK
ncbi:putative Nudix hydrolase 3 [Blattamonas nauphoetae]|uniref:Nudix hydrolase 3 n=1 Tax=Blattamonas nauphoetae TaxID=2049346 RepID=A0ABQ9Y084_9EUKA|nr:putative Nudix hydrolase 3 [Blattamonas nauphoetae]